MEYTNVQLERPSLIRFQTDLGIQESCPVESSVSLSRVPGESRLRSPEKSSRGELDPSCRRRAPGLDEPASGRTTLSHRGPLSTRASSVDQSSQRRQAFATTLRQRSAPAAVATSLSEERGVGGTASRSTLTARYRQREAELRQAREQRDTTAAGRRPVYTASSRPATERSDQPRSAMQPRTTLTAKQRQRESEYQRQIRERDSEIRRLKEHTKALGDKLSKKNDLQMLKHKDKKELTGIIQQLQKEKNTLQHYVTSTIESLRRECDDDGDMNSLEDENSTLLQQLRELERLVQDHQIVQGQFSEKIAECERLSGHVQEKNEICDDLGRQLNQVSMKNNELAVQNHDLQRQVYEIDSINTQCASLKENLDHVEVECVSAKMEVESLKGKVSSLESVVQQMREATEKKRELMRQHGVAQEELRLKKGEIQKLNGVSESERQTSLDIVQTLESKIRELEKKAEAQKLQQEELMLEVSTMKKQAKYRLTLDSVLDGSMTPDSVVRLSANGIVDSSPEEVIETPASEMTDYGRSSSRARIGVHMAGSSIPTSVITSTDIDKIMTKIDNDNKILSELDKSRSSVAAMRSVSSSASTGTLPTSLSPQSTPYDMTRHLACVEDSGATVIQMPSTLLAASTYGAGSVPSVAVSLATGPLGNVLLPTDGATGRAAILTDPHMLPLQTAAGAGASVVPQQPLSFPASVVHLAPQVDMLDVPGKGRCEVYIARYTYDPFQHSPNDAPESELALSAGDYVLVWRQLDQDGFLDGEMLDGRRGLVPSNFVQKLVGPDLLEFHRHVVSGLQNECDSLVSALPPDLDYNNPGNEALLCNPPAAAAAIAPYPTYHPGLDESLMMESGNAADHLEADLVPCPRRLTLERQMSKSIVISWVPPETGHGYIECYHVYVDGLLRATVKAGERTRALIEDVDSTRAHRICLRTVTHDLRTSRDAACTMLIGHNAPIAPSCVRAVGVTPTSAVVTWLPSNSNYEHTVCVNNVEICTVNPGVYRHKITGIAPNTLCRVSVNVRDSGSTPHHQPAHLSSFIEFRTLAKCVPDPPVDVQCELGPQEGTLLVTWLPVTIKSTLGTSNGAPVTGYAVYADGKKVADLNSPTGDHAVINVQSIQGFNPRYVTVRTKSRDCVSGDSVPYAIPMRGIGGRLADTYPDELFAIPEESEQEVQDYGRLPMRGAAVAGRRRNAGYHQSRYANDTEDTLSDRDPMGLGGGYASIPQIEITKDSASEGHGSFEFSEEDSGSRGIRSRGRAGGRPRPAQGHRAYQRDGGYARSATGPQPPPRGPAPASGSDQSMRIFVALFDYDPPTMSPNPDACDEELPFREGQLIKIYGDKDADGFFWGVASGRSGYVPCNMVSEVQVDDDRLAQELLAEEERPQGAGGGGERAARSGRPMEDRWGDIYANMPVKRMVALYDYDPKELSPNVDAEVELSFRTGEVVLVYGDMDDDGFYMGEIDGLRGLVPSNFLTDAPQNYSGGERSSRSAPGPGVHGPPPPPRDKADGRGSDRRKGPQRYDTAPSSSPQRRGHAGSNK